MVVQHSPQVTEESDEQYFLRLARENKVDQAESRRGSSELSAEFERAFREAMSSSIEECSSKLQRRSLEEKPNEKKSRPHESLQVADKDRTKSKVKANDSEPPPKKVKSIVVVPQQSRRDREISALQKEIDEMETALASFPFRHIGFGPIDVNPNIICVFCGQAGRHYSDSCPVIVSGNLRQKVVEEAGRCSKCLKFCGGCQPSKCWYCEQVKKTIFKDEVPEGAHHRAVCPMPDMKRELRARIDRKKEELEALKSEGPSHR
ncbi:unnamed protein product [Heligmosomoides polygyrus]|uniref:CCHC-type domain-containing protein n=1 Tax=Heligmosomoides polygyrus TaxID=6339 RepID=A0A183FMC5_HELPZ|nr:unnamed protein product [Heligmosomoides polygyrus]